MLQTDVVEKIRTHIVCSVTFIFEIPAIYEMWKNNIERGGSHMTIWCMRIACWIPDATSTLSKYVIFIAFLLQRMVAPTRVSVALCVYCHSSLMLNLVAHIITGML